MTTPEITPDIFYDGVAGNTPVSAAALNRIWAALMSSLLDQLVPRQVRSSNSINIRNMMIVDASDGPVVLQAPQAISPGNWGARKIDNTSNPVTIVSTGADVLDEHGRTSWTLVSQDDDAIFSYASPGHFMLWRSNTAALPATAVRYGPIKISGDLAGTADAIRVPGKENVGVAQNLVTAHTQAPDPHGDRSWSQQNASGQILSHSQSSDPHGDRAWGRGQFVPLSWFDANGQLLPSHTGQLSIINTFVVSSQAAMLALIAQTGDLAIRTDPASQGGQRTYVLQGSDPTVLSNWTEMPSIGAVSSVRGSASGTAMTGNVVLGYADVGAPSATDPRIVNSEVTGNKGAANGYAPLNSSGLLSSAYLLASTSAAYGVIKLGGDLGGTAAAPTVPGLLLKATTPVLDATIYTAAKVPAAGVITQYNAGGGSFTQLLPAAPTGTSAPIIVEVKNLTPVASVNTVTFTPAGTDTIEGAAGSVVLRTFHEVKRLIGYNGNWTADLGHLSLTSLDSRYVTITSAHMVPAGGATGYALVKNTATDYDYSWAAVGTAVNTQYDLRIVSVRNYGAVGDGATDDTNAVKNALANTPAGGICYMPQGIYGITSPIVVPPQVTLLGAHTDTLWYTGATPIPCALKVLPAFTGNAAVRLLGKTAGGYTTSVVGQRLRNLTIDCTSAPTGVKGVQLFGFVREATLERVTVRKATDNAFAADVDSAATAEQSTAPQSLRYIGCVADNPTGAGFSFSNVPDTTLYDCNSQGAGWIGYYIAGMPNSTFIACRAEWSGQYGFYITSGYWGGGQGSGGFTMNGCMTDRNNYDGIRVDATGASSILINSQIARRDGRNAGGGGGNYAAVCVTGATMPTMIESIIVYPGQDDANNATNGPGGTAVVNSPQIGIRALNSTHVAVAGASYVHAYVTPFSDGGGNGVFYRANALGTATGPTSAPVRQAPLPSSTIRNYASGQVTPSATAGTYGTIVTVGPSTGRSALTSLGQMVIDPYGVTGETITYRLVFTYTDGTTSTQTVNSTGTTYIYPLIYALEAGNIKDNLNIASISFSTTSTKASSTAYAYLVFSGQQQ